MRQAPVGETPLPSRPGAAAGWGPPAPQTALSMGIALSTGIAPPPHCPGSSPHPSPLPEGGTRGRGGQSPQGQPGPPHPSTSLARRGGAQGGGRPSEPSSGAAGEGAAAAPGAADHVQLRREPVSPAAPVGRRRGRPEPFCTFASARAARLLRPLLAPPSPALLPFLLVPITGATHDLSEHLQGHSSPVPAGGGGRDPGPSLPAPCPGAGPGGRRWGGGNAPQPHAHRHAGPSPTPLGSAHPGAGRGAAGRRAGGALATLCPGHAAGDGGTRGGGGTSRTQDQEMGWIRPPPRLAQDQKEPSIPAPDLSPMTPSPCETLPWQL